MWSACCMSSICTLQTPCVDPLTLPCRLLATSKRGALTPPANGPRKRLFAWKLKRRAKNWRERSNFATALLR
jgi:hypothetical protein